MFLKERFYEGPLFSNLKKTQFYLKSRRTQILHQKITYNHGEQVYKKRPVSDIAGDVQQNKEHHTLTGNFKHQLTSNVGEDAQECLPLVRKQNSMTTLEDSVMVSHSTEVLGPGAMVVCLRALCKARDPGSISSTHVTAHNPR